MKTKYIASLILSGLISFSTVSCTDDLDQTPPYEVTSATVYNDFNNYKRVLAKVYAGYALTGQQGPAGDPDITGGDEGFSSYLRQYWQLQELPTDEAVIGWGDAGLPDLHDMDWTPNNQFITAMFARIYYQISLSNEFIRETSDDKLSERGITGANADAAREFRAEARFLRALSYYHALDLFGNVPFVDENDAVGAFFPEQITRAELFDYVEQELLAVESQLVEPRQNEYARADKAAAWMLLAKLYLNAEVYANENRYADALTYSKKVVDAYPASSLEGDYDDLFLADNHTANGIIFPIAFDGLRTQTYGGTTYLVHAPVGGSMKPKDDFGIDGGWAGLRTTSALVNLFPSVPGSPDDRANFYTDGQTLEIAEIGPFSNGYAIAKFKNITSGGQIGSHPGNVFVDTDFPLFRVADAYLMYAEAALRANGDRALALDLINALRFRAYGDNSGNISQSDLTLNFILDERARELYWEGHRRTDLIRYGLFTGSEYLWPWKGGVPEGRAVAETRKLYPIPSADIIANPNLVQNPGY
ncbi:RagB/SusD family nutrient uptake outer membrane protein [Pontibacter anaerobius]|uniref:RagB/SusD family nutrient uptake outer membrane protein n=1 Tax=Pontibacter anaerobius TaxID=2993940 RepID=A0ABT3RFI0_9BACT|nr:RagB/SusD family nutrient uptake outer membrane protein [Pontibacter anaerobius]MCX2740310.1 RagB/SusD family nutrient uptake outer membrane protein [Pontibacter anaerobius]